MASMKITVKILKPDSGGNMQRCWNAYSTVVRSSSGVDAETYRVMGYKECYRLLSDMVGSSAASNVDLAPVFEVSIEPHRPIRMCVCTACPKRARYHGDDYALRLVENERY